MLPSHLAKSCFSLPYQFCFCPHNSPHAPQRHNAIIVISPLLLSTPTTGTFRWIVTQYFHLCMLMNTLKDTNADCEWPALGLSFPVYHIISQSLQFSAVSIFWSYSNILCVKSILISYLHTWFIQLFTWGHFPHLKTGIIIPNSYIWCYKQRSIIQISISSCKEGTLNSQLYPFCIYINIYILIFYF